RPTWAISWRSGYGCSCSAGPAGNPATIADKPSHPDLVGHRLCPLPRRRHRPPEVVTHDAEREQADAQIDEPTESLEREVDECIAEQEDQCGDPEGPQRPHPGETATAGQHR